MTIFKNSFSSTASVDLCLNNAIALAQVDGPSMCVAQGENMFSAQAISDVMCVYLDVCIRL